MRRDRTPLDGSIRILHTLLILALVAIGAANTAVATLEDEVRSIIESLRPHGFTETTVGHLDRNATPILLRLLRDPSVSRPDNAVAVLGLVGDRRAVPALVELASSPPSAPESPETDRARLQAPVALANLARRNVPGALDALLELAKVPRMRTRSDPGAIEQTAFALSLLSDERARARLDDLAATGIVDGKQPTPPSNATPPKDAASTPLPRSADTGAVLHAVPLSFANHPEAPVPIDAARIDTMLEVGSYLTRSEDDPSDTACCVHFTRGDTAPFGTIGDGLDIISNETELDAALSDRSARIKVVRAINWCGGPGTNFSGCATQRGFGAVVVRISDPALEAGLWMHEFGHNAGLEHVAASRNVMSPTGGYTCGPFAICADDVWTQSQCDALHAPPSSTRVAPVAIGVCGEMRCGDGQLDPFELCDDGNASSEDACTNLCQPAVCGDGFVQAGVEECDDGNSSDEDACRSDCTAAVCGDGIVQNEVEECDDGNDDDHDGCTTTCITARCGDGIVHRGVESCDDAGTLDGDGCDAVCRVEACHTCGGEPSLCGARPEDEICDDGDPLTGDDHCAAGNCRGTPFGLDGFAVYKAKTSRGAAKPVRFGPVSLTTQVGTTTVDVAPIAALALPASLDGSALLDDATALAEYTVKSARGEPKPVATRHVNLVNPCLPTLARLEKPLAVQVPSSVDLLVQPSAPDAPDVDSLLCFKAKQETRGPTGGAYPRFPKRVQVDVSDRFQSRLYELKKLSRVCLAADVATDPNRPPTILSGPARGAPHPVADDVALHPRRGLACYKAGLARRRVPQAGCAPKDPRDSGERIAPRQDKHSPNLGVFVASDWSTETIDSKKEIEICLASSLPQCGNGAVEPGETCDGGADTACPGACTAACRCGRSGELAPCPSLAPARWRIAVAQGEHVRVAVDTIDAESAADLSLRVHCPGTAIDLVAEDTLACRYLPPSGLCAEARFVAPMAGNCEIEVSAHAGCASTERAGYAIAAFRNGAAANAAPLP